MKKRKTALVAFLLAAFLGLGVGYAVVTDTLTLNGDVTVKPHQDNFSVIFTKVETQDKCTASILDDKTVASFSTSQLRAPGETATAVFEITNTSTAFDAKVNLPTITISDAYKDIMDEYFTYTMTLSENSTTAVEVKSAGTTTLTITLTLKKAPVEEKVGKFTIGLVTEAVEIDA